MAFQSHRRTARLHESMSNMRIWSLALQSSSKTAVAGKFGRWFHNPRVRHASRWPQICGRESRLFLVKIAWKAAVFAQSMRTMQLCGSCRVPASMGLGRRPRAHFVAHAKLNRRIAARAAPQQEPCHHDAHVTNSSRRQVLLAAAATLLSTAVAGSSSSVAADLTGQDAAIYQLQTNAMQVCGPTTRWRASLHSPHCSQAGELSR